MPCDDPETKRWIRVEGGSTFHCQVSSDNAHTIRFVRDGVELIPSPSLPQVLIEPHRYQWWISINSASSNTEVEAKIVKSDGTLHGDAYCHRPPQDPATTLVTITANTKAAHQ